MNRVLHIGACCAALLLSVLSPLRAAKPGGNSDVLIVVNDNTPPEDGTNGEGASQYVGEYYAAMRGIPAGNIVHIRSGGSSDPRTWAGWNVSWQAYLSEIRDPILQSLEDKGSSRKIKYIVTTYGVPTHITDHPMGQTGLSVDSFLSLLDTTFATALNVQSPLYNADPQSTAPLRLGAFHGQLYLVARLDGPSARIAAGLVDKALAAEAGLPRNSGTGYFDWRNVSGGPYAPFDQSMKRAYDLCVAAGMQCLLNDQTVTGNMIMSAPDTLWAWGWYGPEVNDVYSFMPGAVGGQLTSYTASSIRILTPSAWVPMWLERGVTATWGATSEPYANFYASGDILLNRMWNGATFGEASYASCPTLGWKMVFVGDPLYKPRLLP